MLTVNVIRTSIGRHGTLRRDDMVSDLQHSYHQAFIVTPESYDLIVRNPHSVLSIQFTRAWAQLSKAVCACLKTSQIFQI